MSSPTPPFAPANAGHASVEEALRAVAIGVSAARGEEIFSVVLRHVLTALGADLAFVSRLLSPEGAHAPADTRLETLCIRTRDGRTVDNVRYSLQGTPCNEVFGKHFHQVDGDLRQRYPGDPMLTDDLVNYYAGYPLFDSAGEPIGLIAAASVNPLPERAVAESLLKIFAVRTAAEIERLQAEASYRTIFNSSEEAIFIHDVNTGAIIDVNPKACEMLGYSHEEMLRMDVGALSSGFPHYTRDDAIRWFARARSGKPQRLEWQRRNRDGSLHWDEVLLRRATIGGVDRIIAMTHEITERKLATEALRRSEQQYRAMVSTALDCIISMDAEGRITGFNPAAEHCFGYCQDDVLGKSLAAMLLPERFREAHQHGMRNFLDTGRGPFLGRRVEVTAQRANGEEFPAELAVTCVAQEHGPLFIGYLRDLTERQQAEADRARLEKQLRQAQRMEAIGQLTGGIAHDFNNLLTSILGYTGMSQNRAAALQDEKLQSHLQQIRRAGERARDLIAQMLTFSRGGRGQPQATDVTRVLKDFLPLLKAALPAGISFYTHVAKGLPTALLDPLQLEQVLMNLCVNARDAIGESGELHVSLATARADQAACTSCLQTFAGDYLTLAIQDSGPGIPEEIRAHMFEPFYSSKALGKGSGMGLAIVHGIVHEWGGHITVDSLPGQHTTFTAHIPCDPAVHMAAAPAANATDTSPLTRLTGRVAVVDDEPLVTAFMSELLQEWGLEVTGFRSPGTALAALGASLPSWDLVILDQVMPDLSGLELAGLLLKQRPDLKVLLYTGYSDRLDEMTVLGHGIRALLRKPLDEAKLHQLLATLLQQS